MCRLTQSGVCSSLHLHLVFYQVLYPKRLTDEDNGSNQNQQKSNDKQLIAEIIVFSHIRDLWFKKKFLLKISFNRIARV